MAANFPLSFRNDVLRKHRRKILLEREKALLPAMQVYVEYRRNMNKHGKEMEAIRALLGDPHTRPRGPEDLAKLPREEAEKISMTATYRYVFATTQRQRDGHRIRGIKQEIHNIVKQSDAYTQVLAALPDTAVRVEEEDVLAKMSASDPAWHEIKALKAQQEIIEKKLAASEEDYAKLDTEYRSLYGAWNDATTAFWNNKNLYEGNDTGEQRATRREFIMKCSDEACRGFLSSNYKCGTCEKWTCSQCLVTIGLEKNATHVCNPDAVATAKTIKAETRPCPKCGTRIFKIDGCFAKDTPILMWNGETKMSQNICAGDELVGDDGEKRVVEATCCGEDEMYEVSQTRGQSYVVNSKHKLALKPYNHISSRNSAPALWILKWFNETTQSVSSKQFQVKEDAEAFLKGLNLSDVVEITVDDYMKLSQAAKDLLYGYKGHEIHWPHKDVQLDPYIMGLWLGDGINNGMDFACNPESDPEIVRSLLDWCDTNGCELVHDDAYRFRVRRAGLTQGREAMNHGATSAACKGCLKKKCDLCDLPAITLERAGEMPKKNPLKETLDAYGLIKNKHIPSDYIVNDRETCLQLLAGFIDTDGCLGNDGKRIQIPQANHSIAKQLALLARSLGFVVSVDMVKKENISFPGVERKDYAPQIRISISGTNLSDIPTRVHRKKCSNSMPNKDWFKTSIRVKSVGKGSYFGWSITGNKRFLMEDMTTLRNCDQMWCVMEGCNTAFSWESGHVIVGTIHNPHYYEWLRRQGGGAPAREVGDIPCGGLPAIHQLMSAVRDSYVSQEDRGALFEIHRNLRELIDMRLRDYPARQPQLTNKDADVDYLTNLLTEEGWQRQLELSEAKFLRKKEVGQILQTLATAGADMMNQITNQAQRAAAAAAALERTARAPAPRPVPVATGADVHAATAAAAAALEKDRQVRAAAKANAVTVKHDAAVAFAAWLRDIGMPGLEQLRLFGNDSLKNLAKRDRMAVPQFEAQWRWVPHRAIYKPKKPEAVAAV